MKILSVAENSLLKPFLFALGYGLLFHLLQFFLSRSGIFIVTPTSQKLTSWDVGFYDNIRSSGYDANSDNTGFFILFPLLWKLSHLSVWGITFLNIVFFAAGFALLMKTLKTADVSFWLLCLTIPSMYFAFLPYTEALFFLLGSAAMYAIKKEKHQLLWIALFLIALVRATTMLMLPGLMVMALLSADRSQWKRSLWLFAYRYALPSLLGLSVFIIWQYLETGIWFAYFKKQASHWGHTFSIPEFPFSNIENGNWRYHWLSALALLLCLIAFIWLVRQGILWLRHKTEQDPNLVFSAGYLTMVLIFILFFNPKYIALTNVMGANRYTLATPFVIYFLHYLYHCKYTPRTIIYFILFANAFFALFRAFESLGSYIVIGLIPTLLITAFTVARYSGQRQSWLITAVIAFNFLIQMHLFQQFITPLYMD